MSASTQTPSPEQSRNWLPTLFPGLDGIPLDVDDVELPELDTPEDFTLHSIGDSLQIARTGGPIVVREETK